ncbi:MAG: 1-phosphofructokinase family hexose kinase [Anaerolineae bacterium]|nr:1-phosphofructokinase family hexose kinase [Anaerolineae bacterium]
MILCVNPNAAIDKTVVVNQFRLNEIHRPQQVVATPGGKGCNAARGLKCLGESPTVTGWVGGFAGQFIEAGLRREGIQPAFVHTDFESRTCLSILDPDNHTLTELYEKGDPVPAAKVDEFIAFFRSIVGQYTAVTMSGSLPPGVQPDFYSRLIHLAREAGVRALLDTSGEALKQGVTAKPYLIKPNEKEFAELAGATPTSIINFARAACDAAKRYETLVVLSLGADGAVASDGTQILHVKPPQLTIKSAVGSGDCMLAGITYGLTRQFPFADAIKYGVAAGTANALTLGAGIFVYDDFERVLAGVTVIELG